jgi:hypothetical protein
MQHAKVADCTQAPVQCRANQRSAGLMQIPRSLLLIPSGLDLSGVEVKLSGVVA